MELAKFIKRALFDGEEHMRDSGVCRDPTCAHSIKELEVIASAFVTAIGCEHFGYLMTRPPQQRSSSEDTVLTTYPAEWLHRYMFRTYKFYDPVVTLSRKTRLPFFWGQRGFLSAYGKAERYVFHEAAEFGIREGYAIPVAGPELDAGVFSIVAKERNEIRDIVASKIGELQLFAVKFHDAVVRLTSLEEPAQIELTAREKEVLVWTSRGYSSEAAAARLGLSAAAVNYHVTNCCRKLNASNKVQAVALATRLHLI